MIRYRSQKQLTLQGFNTPFETELDANNRWVTLGEAIPWDGLAEGYYQGLSSKQGRPSKDARLVIGAVIIKHKLCLSDQETVRQIQENPYLQYFVGLPGYQSKPPFAPSLFVEIRRRMGEAVFECFHGAIIEAIESKKAERNAEAAGTTVADEIDPNEVEKDNQKPEQQLLVSPGNAGANEEPTPQGKLILDATVAEQAIRFPTDLSLLNEARELSERIIDELYPKTALNPKPRTYRQKARKAYLGIVKQRRAGRKVLRRGIKQQLQYLRRNLGHIERLLESWPEATPIPLPNWLLHRYWVIQHLYQQQCEMHLNKSRRCEHRIVSISQPHVRPIIRGKLNKPVEFGAKLSVSLTGEGIARVDQLRWEAFHEGHDLKAQVQAYRDRYGHYPEAVLGDPVYGTRDNRSYLKERGIRFAGKPLGRPKKVTEANQEALKQVKQQQREDYRQRIPIEGKFGQGKGGYGLNYVKAKTASTSEAWINSIFLVMNLLVLLRIFFGLSKSGVAWAMAWLKGDGTVKMMWATPTMPLPDIEHEQRYRF